MHIAGDDSRTRCEAGLPITFGHNQQRPTIPPPRKVFQRKATTSDLVGPLIGYTFHDLDLVFFVRSLCRKELSDAGNTVPFSPHKLAYWYRIGFE